MATQQQQQEPTVTIKELVEAGAHFGHQKRRWNPKMKRFIFDLRNGVYIIDLAKTLQQLRLAIDAVKEIVGQRKSILFVGTKKQAKEVIRSCAEDCGEFYVAERWLGGMLTNMQTIRHSIKTLEKIEKDVTEGVENFTKKELSLLSKHQTKLERHLSGVRTMRRLPGLLIVVDPSHEHIAVAEANKLGIPVLALVDTNCNPDPIQYVVPCNDDALKSIKLILQAITQAIMDEKNRLHIHAETEEEQAVPSSETSQKE